MDKKRARGVNHGVQEVRFSGHAQHRRGSSPQVIMAVITGLAVAGSTGNPLFGILAGAAWLVLVGYMDANRTRPPGSGESVEAEVNE